MALLKPILSLSEMNPVSTESNRMRIDSDDPTLLKKYGIDGHETCVFPMIISEV